jgi:hypothetical protein
MRNQAALRTNCVGDKTGMGLQLLQLIEDSIEDFFIARLR